MFVQRLLDAPKNHLKAFAFGGLVVAQAVTGTALAAQADTSPKDGIAKVASAEAKNTAQALHAPQTARRVSAQQLLKLAESQVGISENSAGGGTKFHAWYMNSPRAAETVARDGGTIAGFANASWCDMFVSWVGHQMGMDDTVGSDAYTVEHAKWFAAHDRWGTTPKPGAVVFFNWNGSKSVDDIEHVGYVIKDNGDGTIKTVEGNTGNGSVEIRTRSTDTVVGYGYPSYAG
ncbi:CHAP domain-containing protein [Sphaerisporangium fuscum]|uniref:CHAP domain-containing protein n=1 Tax=Sphaerisporangium fuscum TaxID=2835868 RepID=UPI001BDCADB9|nr:CHAP domain-containing protein [Sphaerisporangium fuscum]